MPLDSAPVLMLKHKLKLIWFGSVDPLFCSQEDQLCFSLASNSLNSFTTHLGGKT